MSELGSQSALLSRLWALSSSPLEPVELSDQAEQLRVFCDSCVDPQTGKVNVDVARSLLPRELIETFTNLSSIVAKEHEKASVEPESSVTPGISQEARNTAAGSNADNKEIYEPTVEVALAVDAIDADMKAIKDEDEANVQLQVEAVASDSNVSNERTKKPQNAYILPVNLPEPNKKLLSLAELHYQVQSQPLARLLSLNHKALTTDAFKTSLMEGRLAVIFGRIEELKRLDKWGLRQRKKFLDPARPATHWDHLLSEAKFVRAGIQGDRRLKIAICHTISQAILEHFERKQENILEEDDMTDSIERVKENEKEKIGQDKQLEEHNDNITSNSDKEKSGNEVDNNKSKREDDLSMVSLISADTPSIISFDSLDNSSEEILKSLNSMKLFDPIYTENLINAFGAVPISKFMDGEVSPDWKRVLLEELAQEVVDELSNVTKDPDTSVDKPTLRLNFKAKAKEIRPPQPPSQQFINVRTGSAWHPEDDARLIQLVCDFHNNWGLIADLLAHTSRSGTNIGPGSSAGVGNEFGAGVAAFTSNVERRTPWQAFERWVSISQVDHKEFKGRYAEQARSWLDAAAKQSTSRKRQAPVILAADSWLRGHRKLRWTSMLEGIRKVKRKRETTPKPSNSGFLTKQRTDQTRPAKMNSARELSKMKFERDQQVSDQFTQRVAPQAQAQAQAQVRVGGTGNVGGNNVNINNARAAARLPSGPGGILNMAPRQNVGAPGVATGISNGSVGTLRQNPAASSVPGADRMAATPLGVPPSIAGIPMPASVAAAAAARQKQRQHQMQEMQSQHAQMKPTSSMGPAGAGQDLTQGVTGLTSGLNAATVAALAQRNIQQARMRQQQSQSNSPLNSPSMSPVFPASQMSSRPQSMPSRPASTIEQQKLAQQQISGQQQLNGQNPQGQQQLQGQQIQQAHVQRPKTAIPFSREQIQELMAQISQKHPNLTPQEVQQLAVQNVRRYMLIQAERQAAQRRAGGGNANADGSNGQSQQMPPNNTSQQQ